MKMGPTRRSSSQYPILDTQYPSPFNKREKNNLTPVRPFISHEVNLTMRNVSLMTPLFIICLASCEKFEEVQEERLDPTQQHTLYNVPYGHNSRQVLDIALPANRSVNTPVVVFIHGGGWVAGDRSVFATTIQRFANEGIACASINYRFASDITHVHHTDLSNDVRAAVEFIASKSKQWQVSPERFGLVGQSAGGQLALITAYTNNGGRIKACASWAGPMDLTDAEQLAVPGAPTVFKTYVGPELKSPADTLRYKGASPYWMVNSYSVPTLLIHGSNDNGVPYASVTRMKSKLDKQRVTNRLVTFGGAGHQWTGKNVSAARNETLSWFKTWL